MVTNTPELPLGLVTAVAEAAARDAARVRLFLEEVSLGASLALPIPLTSAFLLELGAALRLLEWERRGLSAHLDAGLPPSGRALREAFRHLVAPPVPPDPPGDTLAYRVMVLFAERFAWAGREELGADVALGEADEEALLEELADFLSRHRPA
jgi:hypothetical protein